MAIISGIWMWGNSAVSNGNFSIDVNFTSYPNDFHYTKLSSFYSIPYSIITYGTSETSVWITGNNSVVKDEYKYMDFGDGGQEISDTAYNYINTYATKISNSTKTLISLENLQYFKTKLDNIYSNVVANPTDEATDTLNKIKIDETIYDINKLDNNQLIKRETELPTATETSPDFVEVSGELYYKSYSQPATTSSSSIPDLTNTTWVWKNNPSVPSSIIVQNINFTDLSGNSYTNISIADSTTASQSKYNNYFLFYNGLLGVSVCQLDGTWNSDNYKVIRFGSDIQWVSGEFYDYLFSNATLQSQSSTYSYVKLSSNN